MSLVIEDFGCAPRVTRTDRRLNDVSQLQRHDPDVFQGVNARDLAEALLLEARGGSVLPTREQLIAVIRWAENFAARAESFRLACEDRDAAIAELLKSAGER